MQAAIILAAMHATLPTSRWLLGLLLRIAAYLLLGAVVTILASLLAARIVLHSLARPSTEPAAAAADGAQLGEPVERIDFYEASGIERQALREYLRQTSERDGVTDYPVYVSLRNESGDYLAEARVIVRWNSGEHRLLVGASGLVQFLLTAEKLEGLSLLVPAGYTRLTQRTIPLGSAYEPEPEVDDSQRPYNIVWDGRVLQNVNQHLRVFRESGQVVPYPVLREQLRRDSCDWVPPAESASVGEGPFAPSEIFQRRQDAVVIIAHSLPGFGTTQATGVVLDPSGVIATAYHVLDKPTATSRAVVTRDGTGYPIVEVLAASKSDDVALLKIEAQNLAAAPLSDGDGEGSELTVIAHAGGAYYSLTHGHISRYWATTHHGQVSVKMSVTAAFADGASGGPLFNSRGQVTGIVSATTAIGQQMVTRIAAPVSAIQSRLSLRESSAADRE
ncbi:MAG: trypsin-like peptidase domain-containing protein [Pirellulaceae bacterium]|nr:trypsin-like peptidase domain-containing protein [Pirellulaceae bacterium]